MCTSKWFCKNAKYGIKKHPHSTICKSDTFNMMVNMNMNIDILLFYAHAHAVDN